MILVSVMVFSISIPAFASDNVSLVQSSVTEENNSVIVTDSGVYINDIYYTQEQFIQLLDTAVETETVQMRNAALIAGTWLIPGVGEVVITAAGVILVAGAVVEVGSWIYNAVVNWFEAREFNKSAEDAVNSCDSNKRNHIMQPKHNWNKFNKDPKWNDVAPILIKTLQEGVETQERGKQCIRTLIYKGETVVVRFMKDTEGLVQYISTAWCK